MKKLDTINKIIITFLMMTMFALPKSSALMPIATKTEIATTKKTSLKQQLEEKTGRKLSLTERIGLKIINKKTKKLLANVLSNQTDCATIVMKNGDIIEAELIEVTSKSVKYKRCNKDEKIEFSIDKSEILIIKASDGEVLFRNDNTNSQEVDSANQKTNGLAVASLVLGILSLIVAVSIWGLIMGILAIIFGVAARKKIKQNPKKFKGRKMATAGMICGIVALAAYAILIGAGVFI